MHNLSGRFFLARVVLMITVRDKASTSGMTCDSDVMEKPSRRWRGTVQQLADFGWES